MQRIKVKGKIINNLIKTSPKPLDIATQTLQLHLSHDVESAGQGFV